MGLKCGSCSELFELEVKFCSKCGESLLGDEEGNRAKTLNVIITFFITILAYIILSNFINNSESNDFGLELLVEFGFAILVMVFCFLDFEGIIGLFKIRRFNVKLLSLIILFPFFSAIIVHFFVSISCFFLPETENYNNYESYLYLDHSLFWAIVFVAIMPPIFEELAFRGFLFNKLKEVTSDKITIIATAFIFAIVHFSFISFLWIFPFGLVLGYFRSKYKTLWFGIIIHFIHNFIVLLWDYNSYLSMIENIV